MLSCDFLSQSFVCQLKQKVKMVWRSPMKWALYSSGRDVRLSSAQRFFCLIHKLNKEWKQLVTGLWSNASHWYLFTPSRKPCQVWYGSHLMKLFTFWSQKSFLVSLMKESYWSPAEVCYQWAKWCYLKKEDTKLYSNAGKSAWVILVHSRENSLASSLWGLEIQLTREADQLA